MIMKKKHTLEGLHSSKSGMHNRMCSCSDEPPNPKKKILIKYLQVVFNDIFFKK